jgi:hypothetical protein
MMTYQQYLEDRRKMKEFVASRIPEEGCRIVLADGEDGELWVHLDPVRYPDGELDLHWETNLPEAVDLDEIYEHFRVQEMTWAERQRKFQGDIARLRVKALAAEVAALRQAKVDMATAAKQAIDRVLNSEATGHETPEKPTVVRSEQPLYQFQLCGDYWVVRFTTEAGTVEGHFLDLEGFRHITKLLAYPDKHIEAIELQGLQDSPVANETMTPQFASDQEYRQGVEKRMADLEQEIAQTDDPSKKIELQEEYDKLTSSQKESGKRRLGPPSPREQARKAVRNALDRAKKRIRNSMPEFARFLDRSILANGTAFRYSPAPPAPEWVL